MADQTPKRPRATHTETPAANKKPRTLLALDGGGVKGISTLILLQAIMDEVKSKKVEGEGSGSQLITLTLQPELVQAAS